MTATLEQFPRVEFEVCLYARMVLDNKDLHRTHDQHSNSSAKSTVPNSNIAEAQATIKSFHHVFVFTLCSSDS